MRRGGRPRRSESAASPARASAARQNPRMRTLLACLLCLLPWAAPAEALRDGDVLLFRHALAPGGGDPPGLRLGDCSTQRNLSDAGREQARRLGDQVRERLGTLAVGAVWASPWCRTLDTARLAFPQQAVQVQPAFASFFNEPAREAALLAQARERLAGWRGPGVLVVVTHQVNITGLTGVFPASGEGVVMRCADGRGEVVARLPAPPP